MIKEIKYIIKRILIGVGIVFVLSFINNVKASALTWDDMEPVVYTHSNSSGLDIYVYYDSTSDRYYYYTSNYPNDYSRYTENASRLPYVTLFWNYANNWNVVYLTSEPLYYDHNFSIQGYNSYRTAVDVNSVDVMGVDICPRTNNSNCPLGSVNNYQYFQNTVPFIISYWDNVNNDPWRSSNYNIYNISNGDLFHSASYSVIPGLSTEFVSWNANKIINNNIITGYFFSPEFTNFDTNNYVYQYKFGKDSTTWLALTENNQELKFNSNGTIYIRIKDSNNNIIDSSTFTISNLGSFNTNVDYKITFSGEYRTSNYLNNTMSSKSSSVIEEYQIYVDYVPKTSTLKYQYQFVLENGSLDSNSWQNVSTSDNGSFTYVATSNGTLYARILDNNDNVKTTSTFTVNSIGTLALDSGNDETTNNFFTKLANKVGFGGPIGSLINIPISLVSMFVQAFSYNYNYCTDYNLGSLFGHNLKLPCVDVKSYLGNSLYNTIDLILSCCMFYMIIKMLLIAYNKFITMENDPMGDSTILYGDRRFD